MNSELKDSCETPKLSKVIRLDSVPVEYANFTEEGYLIDHPILTTTGIFEYKNPDGSMRRELRLPEEVFDEESLKSYRGKPIVITHDAGLITKNNVGNEQIGTILSDGYKDKDSVRAEIVIHDTNEMRKSGLKELSLGYNLDLEETPGTWHGERYDAIQRNIRINHLALVREARAGDNARLNIDSRDSTVLKGGIAMAASKKRKNTKKTNRADGVLSREELKKAIEEYKMRKKRKLDSCKPDTVKEKVKDIAEAVAEDAHDDKIPSYTKGDLTPAINKCLMNRDERDEAGDPKDMMQAMDIIARQDEDIQSLFDIIDTLLAERDYDASEEKTEEKPEEKETEEIEEVIDEDADDEEVEEESDDIIEVGPDGKEINPEDNDDGDDEDLEEIDDEDFEEEVEEDGDDDPDDEDIDIEVSEEEETEEDGDDDPDDDEDDEEEEVEEEETEEEFEEDSDDDDVPCRNSREDSIDAIVNARVNLGMMGRTLNMDGLEKMEIRDAKRAIIRKVKPIIRLDGKSDAYIDALYDLCADEIKKSSRKTVNDQRKQMYTKKTVRADSGDEGGAEAARKRMIRNMKNNKANIKNKKEDK